MSLLQIAARVASRRYADVPAAPMPQTAAPAAQKIYRVITDEPQGVAVGFKPSPEALKSIGAELDEWDLVEDDKSDDAMPFLSDDENGVRLLSESAHTKPEGGWDLSPLGMDMGVWRSEQEMLEQLGSGGEGDMSFSGKVSQRFDGENCSAEGKLTIDGKVHEFSCGTSGRDPTQCKLDGQDLPDTDPLHERIELFMTDIWPQEDGNWDAAIENNVTRQAPTPVQDE